MDKLSVLRRDRQVFEVLLHPKDLKPLNKERRNQLITSLQEQPIDEPMAEEEQPMASE